MSETQCYYDSSRGYPRGGCYPTPIHKILNVPVSCLSHHLRSECFFLSGQHSPKYRSQKLSIDSRSHHHGLHYSLEYLLISHSMQSVSTAPSSPSLYPYSTIPIELSSFPHFLLASPSFLAILGTIAKTRIAFLSLWWFSELPTSDRSASDISNTASTGDPAETFTKPRNTFDRAAAIPCRNTFQTRGFRCSLRTTALH